MGVGRQCALVKSLRRRGSASLLKGARLIESLKGTRAHCGMRGLRRSGVVGPCAGLVGSLAARVDTAYVWAERRVAGVGGCGCGVAGVVWVGVARRYWARVLLGVGADVVGTSGLVVLGGI